MGFIYVWMHMTLCESIHVHADEGVGSIDLVVCESLCKRTVDNETFWPTIHANIIQQKHMEGY